MTMRIVRIAAIALLLATISVTAFARGQADRESERLDFALSGNPDTLDPHKTSGTLTFQVIRSLYDTLVEPDEQGVIVPALAESYSVSNDALRWSFTLRRGVTFHNGAPLTSEDVKATFERLKAPETASPKAAEFAAIASIETPDEGTVVFTLSQPSAPLLASLASGWGAILPASLIASGHDFAAAPVGTGPFRFVEWVRDSRIVFERNDSYWMRGYPKLAGVTINIITEGAVSVQALLAGELDALDLVNTDDVPVLEAAEGISLTKELTALVMVMAINTSRPPLDRLEVRQALNYAIDKQTVLDVAYGGGVVVGTFMDYGDPYYLDTASIYPYDPAKARSLLASAGIGPETVITMALPQNYEPHVLAGELYQEMLEKVGLNVVLRLVDWSTWLSDVYTGGNYDLTVIGHTGKLDPDGRLAGYGTARSYVRWESPRVAELIAEAKRTSGFEARKAIYDEVLGMMAREVPHVYTGTAYRYLATRSDVTGLRMDTKLDTFDFRYVEIR